MKIELLAGDPKKATRHLIFIHGLAGVTSEKPGCLPHHLKRPSGLIGSMRMT
jgi:hypothetical protein